MNNIISIVAIIASVGLFLGYVDPTYSSIKELRLEKLDYDRALNNSNELQEEKAKLLKKYEEIPDANIEALTKLLPDNIDNIRLIIDIDEIAKIYAMSIRNFKAETGEKKDTIGKDNSTYGTLTLSFSTSAAYDVFIAFMKDIERSLRIMDVISIDFNALDTNPIHDYNVTIKTYWLK